jgi:hypothetical protein
MNTRQTRSYTGSLAKLLGRFTLEFLHEKICFLVSTHLARPSSAICGEGMKAIDAGIDSLLADFIIHPISSLIEIAQYSD